MYLQHKLDFFDYVSILQPVRQQSFKGHENKNPT